MVRSTTFLYCLLLPGLLFAQARQLDYAPTPADNPQMARLTRLLPGEPARQFKDTFSVKELKPGKYQVALRMPNPMPTGKPVRFANKTQDEHLAGWLTLGEVEIK